MRILVLGGGGMLGHQLLHQWSGRHDVRAAVRGDIARYRQYPWFAPENTYPNVDASQTDQLLSLFAEFRPEVVVNAVGIIKQRSEASNIALNVEVNALLPHRLAALCAATRSRLVHLSTDCVFSGLKGNYKESESPDPVDLYGMSKLLGEPTGANVITLRTSMIGPELGSSNGLLEWYLAQRGRVSGYTRAIFSGLTTLELARVIELVAVSHSTLSGMFHVGAEPISKFDLLTLVREKLNVDNAIDPDDQLDCNRSLDSSLFRKVTGYQPPSWETMVAELAGNVASTRALAGAVAGPDC